MVYGEPTQAELEAELALMVQVDQAHLVMLAQQRLIQPETAARLLACIDELAAEQFSALRSRPAPRGPIGIVRPGRPRRSGAAVASAATQ